MISGERRGFLGYDAV